MSSDPAPVEGSNDQLMTIWRPTRTGLTVALGLPAVVISAAITGMLLSILVPPEASIATAVGGGVVVAALRVLVWVRWVGGRSVAASPTRLAVCQNGRIVRELAWGEAASVSVSRGDGPLRLFIDVLADASDFPSVCVNPKDVWDVRGSFPAVLAVLPSELQRLEAALHTACQANGVPFRTRDGC